ncbi:MAG TPA: DUF368 domain-containing protein, partial [Candidatus Limnocylindria bacterium]|nr:DUF368 domain-containing protein [Candidatus Limnocylindria bacterium]
LEHRHALTMSVLTGLMIGSVRALWPWQTEERDLLPPPSALDFVLLAGLALVGFVAVTLLVYAGRRRDAAPTAD